MQHTKSYSAGIQYLGAPNPLTRENYVMISCNVVILNSSPMPSKLLYYV